MKTIKIIALSTIVSLSLLSITIRSEEPKKLPEQKEADQSSAGWGWLSGLAEKLKELSNKTVDYVSETAKEAYEKGGELYQNTSTLYKKYGEPMVEYAAEKGSEALAYAKEKGGKAFEVTGDYANRVYEATVDLAKKAYEGAQDLNKIYQEKGAKEAVRWLKAKGEVSTATISEALKQKLVDARESAIALYDYAQKQAPALKQKAQELYRLTAEYTKEGAALTAQQYKVNERKIRILANQLQDKLLKMNNEAAQSLAQSAKNIMDVSKQQISELYKKVVQIPAIRTITAQAEQKGTVEKQIIKQAQSKPETAAVKTIEKTDKKTQEETIQVPVEAQKQ